MTPRFFRYTHTFVAPASLLIGAGLGDLWERLERCRALRVPRLARLGKGAFALAFLALALGSVAQGFRIARLYRDHHQDARFAARLLASLPPRPIYSDYGLYPRFYFETGYRRMEQPRYQLSGLDIQPDIVGKGFLEPLRGLREGYVVFGGSRGVEYGTNWILKNGATSGRPIIGSSSRSTISRSTPSVRRFCACTG